MYAIIEAGGKQVVVSPGENVQVEKLEGEVGSPVEFGKVVVVSKDDGTVLAGAELQGAKVTGTIAAQTRGKKVIVYKFKRRKMYRRKNGHRQDYTQVTIGDVVV
jgi:large subunit ribosomal protein L21